MLTHHADVQVTPYVPLVMDDAHLRKLIGGLIKRQACARFRHLRVRLLGKCMRA